MESSRAGSGNVESSKLEVTAQINDLKHLDASNGTEEERVLCQQKLDKNLQPAELLKSTESAMTEQIVNEDRSLKRNATDNGDDLVRLEGETGVKTCGSCFKRQRYTCI